MTRLLPALLLLALPLFGHVGSPDVFFEGTAGPYPLSISIRPPTVIPGIAEVEIRTSAQGVQSIHVVPYPLVGVASKLPPTPDIAKQSAGDPHFFSSSVWLMAFGSYQVRVDVNGAAGHGTLSVPIPSVARETKQMQRGLGWVLALLMGLIFVGAVSIAGAAVRESTLPAAEIPDGAQVRRSRLAMLAATAGLAAVLVLGNWWWSVEASGHRDHIYRPPLMQALIENGTLVLQSQFARLLPDHGHLMHLFVVRMPEMDRMWHLHPDLISNVEFRGPSPSLPAGHYKLFADIVRASGFPETPVADLDLAQPVIGHPLSGDDAQGSSPPLSRFDPQRDFFELSDSYRMVRTNASGPLAAKQMQHLSFVIEDSSGQPAADLEPYMGMAAHAEFISADASVFAHVHPFGTVPMASLGLTAGAASAHENHMMMHIPAQIAFPYGFPKAGKYRMFIQVQRKGKPETAAFDFDVK